MNPSAGNLPNPSAGPLLAVAKLVAAFESALTVAEPETTKAKGVKSRLNASASPLFTESNMAP